MSVVCDAPRPVAVSVVKQGSTCPGPVRQVLLQVRYVVSHILGSVRGAMSSCVSYKAYVNRLPIG